MNERAIFIEALNKTSLPDQAAFLNESCGIDVGLRDRVEALLKAHGSAGRFLSEPAAPIALISAIDIPVFNCASRYCA